MSHTARLSRPALLACAAALALPSAASAACSSPPVNASVADSPTDSPYGLAPEATSLGVSVDAACNAAFSYTISNEPSMLTDDFLSWFINTDGSTATGSQAGFLGADYAIGRLGTSGAYLSRYDATSGSFVSVGPVTTSGVFGASVDLSTIATFGTHAMTVAGGATWTGPSGTRYNDWVPEPLAAPLGFSVALSAVTAPIATPAPTVAPVVTAPVPTAVPTPTPMPAATSAPSVVDDDTNACEVPTVRRISLTKARARIRHAGCAVGSIHKKTSKVIPAGDVIQADQAPGDYVDLGTKLNLTVSTGKPHARRLSEIDPADQVTDLVNAAVASADR